MSELEFNGQFREVFNKNNKNKVLLVNRSAPFMKDILSSADAVTKPLQELNPSKAIGPDIRHPGVLKLEIGHVFA